jgi:hypothetical protein
MDMHKMALDLNYLERYNKDGDELLNQIIRVTAEGHIFTKQAKKSKQILPEKLMANIFWDRTEC